MKIRLSSGMKSNNNIIIESGWRDRCVFFSTSNKFWEFMADFLFVNLYRHLRNFPISKSVKAWIFSWKFLTDSSSSPTTTVTTARTTINKSESLTPPNDEKIADFSLIFLAFDIFSVNDWLSHLTRITSGRENSSSCKFSFYCFVEKK